MPGYQGCCFYSPSYLLFQTGVIGAFWSFGDVVRFTFSPTALIVYIILWIVIPEASTTSEKLEMKGEKVDMNSIKASVMEEMKGVGKKAEKFGKDASSVVSEKANVVAGDVKNFAKRNRGGLGNVIALIAKTFAYFIIGVVSVRLGHGIIRTGHCINRFISFKRLFNWWRLSKPVCLGYLDILYSSTYYRYHYLDHP